MNLRLRVGGNLPYKWRIYEYPQAGGPPVALLDGAGQGDGRVNIPALAPNETRKLVWSVAAVNLDDEQVVDVRAQTLATDTVVGELKTTWRVRHPAGACFVHLHLTASRP